MILMFVDVSIIEEMINKLRLNKNWSPITCYCQAVSADIDASRVISRGLWMDAVDTPLVAPLPAVQHKIRRIIVYKTYGP